MLCTFCRHNDSKVIDSRDSGDSIRRRRECSNCARRYTTYERAESRSLRVIKQDGRREDFNIGKLFTSLTRACAKRPFLTGTLEKMADEIEAKLMDSGKSEVSTRAIGELVVGRLRDLDPVAYIRFASVYKDFSDIEAFKESIDSLLEPQMPLETSSQLSFLEDDSIPIRRRRGRPKRNSTPSKHRTLT